MMSAFLNLALFVGVFYLIVLYAGRPDRTTGQAEPAAPEKRIA